MLEQLNRWLDRVPFAAHAIPVRLAVATMFLERRYR
jgi:hypothetical protein